MRYSPRSSVTAGLNLTGTRRRAPATVLELKRQYRQPGLRFAVWAGHAAADDALRHQVHDDLDRLARADGERRAGTRAARRSIHLGDEPGPFGDEHVAAWFDLVQAEAPFRIARGFVARLPRVRRAQCHGGLRESATAVEHAPAHTHLSPRPPRRQARACGPEASPAARERTRGRRRAGQRRERSHASHPSTVSPQ